MPIHSSSKWLKPAKNKLPWCVFTTFSTYLITDTYTTSVSGHYLCIIVKICQIVTGTSTIRQFHEFFWSNFWLVLEVWPNYAVGGVLPCPWTPFSDRLFVQKVCELLMPKFPGRKITVIAFFCLLFFALRKCVIFIFKRELLNSSSETLGSAKML